VRADGESAVDEIKGEGGRDGALVAANERGGGVVVSAQARALDCLLAVDRYDALLIRMHRLLPGRPFM
jgi:hypothetical protein